MKKRVILVGFVLSILIGIILGIIYLTTKYKAIYYGLGFYLGVITVLWLVVLIYFIFKKKSPKNSHFDERQLKKRGDCFCISFFVLIGCLFLDGMFRYALEMEWSNYLVGVGSWIMVAIGVFAILAIWKDAYTSIGENKLRLGIFLLGIGIFDIIIGLMNGFRIGFLEDGKLGICFINLFGGSVLLLVVINLFIKVMKDRKDEFVDEELETEVC